MTLLNAVKKETGGMLARMGLRSDDMMHSNFRIHGPAMGFHRYEDYCEYAEKIYTEAMKNPDAFSIVELPKSKIAVDFQSKIRGVYNEFGQPLAFFQPEPKQMGFDDPEQEMKEFVQSIRYLM